MHRPAHRAPLTARLCFLSQCTGGAGARQIAPRRLSYVSGKVRRIGGECRGEVADPRPHPGEGPGVVTPLQRRGQGNAGNFAVIKFS